MVNRGDLAFLSGALPGAFSDRGCLLFQVGLAPGGLPGRVCLGNVTNVGLLSTHGVYKDRS